jgi:hypothetical protein
MTQNKKNGQIHVPIQNTNESHLVGVAGIALILHQLQDLKDDELRNHLIEAAQELCDEIMAEQAFNLSEINNNV